MMVAGYISRSADNGGVVGFFASRFAARARRNGPGIIPSVWSSCGSRKGDRRQKQLLHEGIDPIEARKATRVQVQLEAARSITFKQVAEEYIQSHEAGWERGASAAMAQTR